MTPEHNFFPPRREERKAAEAARDREENT